MNYTLLVSRRYGILAQEQYFFLFMLFLNPRYRVRRDSRECGSECVPYKMDELLMNGDTNHTSGRTVSKASM